MSLKSKLKEAYTIIYQNEDVPEWVSDDPDVIIEIQECISDALNALKHAIRLIN